jgi:two-component system OmpR family response regulator
VGQFRWMAGDVIPANVDLRRQGWALVEDDSQGVGCVPMIQASALEGSGWHEFMAFTRPDDRRLMVVTGVECSTYRARLLAEGFGDAVGDRVLLEELEARARRLVGLAGWMPRQRSMGALDLDLMAREACYHGKSINLHPREFGLLWRLAETPDEPVSKHKLVQGIWRLGFPPESNSIAVQMSRMRSKLKTAGLLGLVRTVPEGYQFCSSVLQPIQASADARASSRMAKTSSAAV